MATLQIAVSPAEQFVGNELLKGGVSLYRPATESSGDFLAKTPKGAILELTLLTPAAEPGIFALPDRRPDPKRFIVALELDTAAGPAAWIFPSRVFHAYSAEPDGNGLRRLNLDAIRPNLLGEPLREYLRGFRDRWELITDYAYYRRFMKSPEGYAELEDELLMLLAVERPAAEYAPVPYTPFVPGLGNALYG